MATDILLKVLLALALGALIGVERERRGHGELVEGLRTFMLISFLGVLSAYFSMEVLNSIVPVFITFALVGILTIFGYYVKSKNNKHIGLTTEVAFLVTFLIGLIVYFDQYPYLFSVSLGIILTLILVSRDSMHHFAKHLKEEEIWDAIIFAIITFIVLPILPRSVTIIGVTLDPFVIWLSIVFVLSISFASYILMKILGARRGLGLTGFFGGLASSTAVSVSMAEESKKNRKIIYSAAFATIVASSVMFFRGIAVSVLFNTAVTFQILLPFSLLGALGLALSYVTWKKSSADGTKLAIGSPLALKSALQFGVFFTVILFVSNLVRTYIGEAGIYIIAIVAGLVDLDAINISLSTLAISTLSPAIAARGVILAALSNTMSKGFLARWLGSKEMAAEVAKVFSVLIAVGLAILFFMTFSIF